MSLTEDVMTFSAPGGKSVNSAASLPRARADHGVSGAAFSTTVQPAARDGASLARLIWVG